MLWGANQLAAFSSPFQGVRGSDRLVCALRLPDTETDQNLTRNTIKIMHFTKFHHFTPSIWLNAFRNQRPANRFCLSN